MSCDKLKELLSGFLDGDLSPLEAEEMTSHLDSCAECRRELEGLKGTQDICRKMLNHRVPPSPSALFTRRVMEAVTAKTSERLSRGAPGIPLIKKAKERLWSGFRERPAMAWTLVASTAAVVLLLALLLSGERSDLRPVYELQARVEGSRQGRGVDLEHYLAEHALNASENPLTGPSEGIKFANLSH